MFKAEYDFDGEEVVADAPTLVEADPVNSITQVSIDTEATVGVITFLVMPRRLKNSEPAFELDGVTPLTVDLSTGRRTVIIAASLQQVSTTATGMDGNYRLLSSGGDE